jgi:membrane protein implicated in regulation of membrane protease activity
MTRALRAARMPAAVGVQGMVGNEGVVRRDGMVQVNGELWRARTAEGVPLVAGEHVRVEQVEEDLRLVVGSLTHANREEPD